MLKLPLKPFFSIKCNKKSVLKIAPCFKTSKTVSRLQAAFDRKLTKTRGHKLVVGMLIPAEQQHSPEAQGKALGIHPSANY